MSFTRSANAAVGDSRGWVRSHRLHAPPLHSKQCPSPPSPPSSVVSNTGDSEGGFSSVSHPRGRAPRLPSAATPPMPPPVQPKPPPVGVFSGFTAAVQGIPASVSQAAAGAVAKSARVAATAAPADAAAGVRRPPATPPQPSQTPVAQTLVSMSADRAWAEVDRLQSEVDALTSRLDAEKDSKALVEEELREVRASLARQARLLAQHTALDGPQEWGGDRPPSALVGAVSPVSSVAGSQASSRAPPASMPPEASKFAKLAASLEAELQTLKQEKAVELQRLDSFLVMAGQENSALRRQLLAAGITPDVVQADGRGAGVEDDPAAIQTRRGLVLSMLSERAAKTRADADKEVLTAQLAQVEANLACEKSERSTLHRQLQDSLTAIDLTHAEMSSQATAIAKLQRDAAAMTVAHKHDVDTMARKLKEATDAVEAARIQGERRVKETTVRLTTERNETVEKLEATVAELQGVVSLWERDARAAANRHAASTRQLQEEHAVALKAVRDDNSRLSSVLEKRRRDYEAELQELESRFTTIVQQRQRTYDRDIARLREEAEVKLADAAARAAEQTRATMDADLRKLREVSDARSLEVGSRLAERTREEMEGKLQEAFAIVAKIKDESRKEVAAAVARARAADSTLPSKVHLQEQLASAVAERDRFKQAYAREARRRRAVHQTLMDVQGNIRVHARVRPATRGTAAEKGMTDLIKCPGEGEMVLRAEGLVGDHRRENVMFEFDVVHTPDAGQDHVFSEVKPLCESVLDGYNVCVFAYGQTGSGKTYTMEGTPESPGVTLRAVKALFGMVQEREPGAEYSFSMSMVEVYMERVRDLLEGQVAEDGTLRPEHLHSRRKGLSAGFKEGLSVREGADGCEIVGLTSMKVNTVDEVLAGILRGSERRAIGTHSLNEHSSRSHMVIRISVEGTVYQGLTRNGSSERLAGAKGGRVTRLRSVLNLIDLAGSERVLRTEVSGTRLKEAQSINKSLSALGDVIAAHKSGSSHVPYRNSKLTFLLKDSLGGDSKVVMFVNVSGDDDNVSETFYSLTFAARCRATALGRARRHVSPATPSHARGYRRAASASAIGRSGMSRTTSDLSVVTDADDVREFNGVLTPKPAAGGGGGVPRPPRSARGRTT